MTEILTESFCERCGTRYTFESPRPKLRLKGVKVVSRGLKNFVLSDGTSMDEAMAAARSETERESTSYQLDAFHKTFNFCMQCRQYTCPNCWNEVEARCLTCAPHLGHEILPAPFPDLSATTFGLVADPTGGGAMLVDGANGVDAANGANGLHAAEPAEIEQPDADFDFMARLDALTIAAAPVAEPVAEIAPVEPAAAEAVVGEPGPDVSDMGVAADAELPAETVVVEQPEPPVVTESADEVTFEPVADGHDLTKIGALDAAVLLIGDKAPERAAPPETTSASPSNGLFSRFTPGQNLDAELDAYEREQAAAAVSAAIVAESATPDAPVEPDVISEAAVTPDVAPEAVAAAPEPEVAPESPVVEAESIIAAEPAVAADAPSAAAAEAAAVTPEVAAQPELAAPEPVVAPEPEVVAVPDVVAASALIEPEIIVAEPTVAAAPTAAPGPVAAEPVPVVPPAVDLFAAAALIAEPGAEPEPVVEPEPEPVAATAEIQPEVELGANDVIAQPTWQRIAPDPTPPLVAPAPPEPPAAHPAAEPQWPSRPAWLGSAPSVGLPFLGRSATPQGGLEALWAESNREVANPPSAAKPAAVQPCVSCGLSLSGNARFCRRCGTAQTS